MSEELGPPPEPPYSHEDVVRIIGRHLKRVPEQRATVGSLWWKREEVTKLAYWQLRDKAAARAIYDAVLTFLTAVEDIPTPPWIELASNAAGTLVAGTFNNVAAIDNRQVRVCSTAGIVKLSNGEVADAVRHARSKHWRALHDARTAKTLEELGLEPAPPPTPLPERNASKTPI